MGITVNDILRPVQALAGENEAIVGSNNTTINKKYGMVGQPYCGGTVKYAFDQAGSALLKGCSNPWYVPTLRQFMQAQGWGVSTPQAGDVFIEGSDMHTGFVFQNLGNGYFVTLEGNGGHVKATFDQAKNGTGPAFEGIGYRKAAVNGGFKFFRPPVEGSGGGTTPTVDLKAKVKEWQKFLGVAQDGDPGPDTERAALKKMLIAMLAKHPLSQGSTGDAVTVLQGLLYAAGYDPNGLDGSYGSGCAAAVRSFEKAAGQSQDGSAGKNVVAALLDKVFK